MYMHPFLYDCATTRYEAMLFRRRVTLLVNLCMTRYALSEERAKRVVQRYREIFSVDSREE